MEITIMMLYTVLLALAGGELNPLSFYHWQFNHRSTLMINIGSLSQQGTVHIP